MENIIVVGTGDVFHRFIAPSLEILEFQRLLKVLATVDIKQRATLEYLQESVKHKVRTSEESLSSLFDDLKENNPIVILSHDNDLHYEDTKNLISSGFRIMLEKPYVVNSSQFNSLKRLIEDNKEKVFLMEYYLMRKMLPLFLLSGMIKKDSFYLEGEEVFRGKDFANGLKNYIGKLKEILGDPVSLKIKILEGRGDSGKLDLRGGHVFDSRRGGGMIQDMGIHALIPLFGLENYIGTVDKSFANGEVRVAACGEFMEVAKKKYNLPERFIGETYAEIDLTTGKGVPVNISVGKYIADRPSQKNLILRGTKGKIDLDMYGNFMHIYEGDKIIERIELVNPKRSRYYPVIKTGLEHFNNKSPFFVNMSDIQMNSQEMALNIIDKSREGRESNTIKSYDLGEHAYNVFEK